MPPGDRATASDLSRAVVRVLDAQGREADAFGVRFNPSEYELTTQAEYAERETAGQRPTPQYVRGSPERLSTTLLFDTYGTGEDLRDRYTGKLDALLAADRDEGAPPTCEFLWGPLQFRGHLESAAKTFTMFDAEGRPVRATVRVTFAGQQVGTGSEGEGAAAGERASRTRTRTVREGDTLWAIAGEAYGDPAEWRRIAEANGVDDPRTLQVGRALVVPPRDRED